MSVHIPLLLVKVVAWISAALLAGMAYSYIRHQLDRLSRIERRLDRLEAEEQP